MVEVSLLMYNVQSRNLSALESLGSAYEVPVKIKIEKVKASRPGSLVQRQN